MSRTTASAPTAGCAFVTGGSGGLGAAICGALAADGWPVAVGYARNAPGAYAIADRILDGGGTASTWAGDLRDPETVEAVFAGVEAVHGRVGVLVNNAGIRADGYALGLEADEWDHVISTNLTVAHRVSQRVLAAMLRARHGRIINVTSILAGRAIPGTANYSASKAGLTGLTRALAVEVARKGVTVNAVAPGILDTELTRELDHFEATVQKVPMRRPAHLDEVAACVAFLASDAASYVTGQTLTVDGGLSAQAFDI